MGVIELTLDPAPNCTILSLWRLLGFVVPFVTEAIPFQVGRLVHSTHDVIRFHSCCSSVSDLFVVVILFPLTCS